MVDATLPTTPITIDGKVYEMCLDLGALSEGEEMMVASGFDVNLLYALPRLNLASTRVIFAASLQYKHPDLTFPERINLLRLPHVVTAANAIANAWLDAAPTEKAKPNPPEPGQLGDEKTGSASGPTPASRLVSRKKSSTGKRRGPSKH